MPQNQQPFGGRPQLRQQQKQQNPQQDEAQRLLRQQEAASLVNGVPKGDTTPFPVNPTDTMVGDTLVHDEAGGLDKAQQADAQRGIAVTHGLPAMTRFKLSFATTDALKADYIENTLKKPMRRDPLTEDLQWYDDTTNRWSPLNEVGTTMGDIADQAGMVLPTTFSVLGQIGGTLTTAVTKIPGLGVAGSASGTALGMAADYWIGRALGLNPEGTGQAGYETAKHAAEVDAAFGIGGNVVTGGYTLGRKLFRPYSLDLDKARAALLGIKPEEQELVNMINAATGGKFRPLTGQMTNDEMLLALVGQAKDHMDTMAAVGTRIRENQTALESFMDTFSKYSEANPDAAKRLMDIQKFVKEQRDDAFYFNYNMEVGATKKGANDAMFGGERKLLDPSNTVDSEVAGDELREMAMDKYKALKKNIDYLYKTEWPASIGYMPAIGESQVKIFPDATIRQYYAGLSTKLKNVLTSNRENQVKALTRGKLSDAIKQDSIIDEEAIVMSGDKVETTFTAHSMEGSKPIDIHWLQDAIEGYRDDLRGMTGGGRFDYSEKELRDHIDQLVSFRDRALDEKGLKDAKEVINDAESLRREQARNFDDTLIGKIFKQDPETKEYKISNRAVFAQLMADPDGQALGQFMKIVNKDPMAVQTVKDTMLDMYREKVINPATQLPMFKKHMKFIDEFKPQLEQVFSTGELAELRSFGKFEGQVKQSEARVKSFAQSLQRLWPEDVINTNPTNLVNKVMGGTKESVGVGNIDDFVHVMNEGKMLPDLRQSTADWVRNEVFTKSEGFNSKKLTALLNDTDKTGRAIKLRAIMGDEYVNNLNRLNKGIEITDRTAEMGEYADKVTDSGLLIKFARTWLVPQLSREGRMSTLAQFLRKGAADRVLADIILDPDKLKEFVRIDSVGANREKIMRFLASVGGTAFVTRQDLNTIQPQTKQAQ